MLLGNETDVLAICSSPSIDNNSKKLLALKKRNKSQSKGNKLARSFDFIQRSQSPNRYDELYEDYKQKEYKLKAFKKEIETEKKITYLSRELIHVTTGSF